MTRSAGKRAQSPGSSSEHSHILATIRVDRAEAVADVGGHRVRFTHLDRVYWPAVSRLGQPAITKRDFLAYPVAVSPALLPDLRDRPLTLFRWPEGLAGRRVLEKHWNIALPSFVERVDVFSNANGHRDQYILCNNLATLLCSRTWVRSNFTAGVRACATGRTRRTRASTSRTPGTRSVAFAVEATLSAIGLHSLVKTSGKTGLHVIVPIRRTLRFDAVREMARVIADRLVRENADDVTLEWDIEKRRGKVFVDANMNVRGKSMIAPWSPRGLSGAPVSMPLTWRRLKDANPMEFRIPTAAALLHSQGDPWRDFRGAAQSVEDALQVAAH